MKHLYNIACHTRIIAVQKQKIYDIEIKVDPFVITLVEIMSLDIVKVKCRNGASVSEVLVLFNCRNG